jgi:hypothetical protein
MYPNVIRSFLDGSTDSEPEDPEAPVLLRRKRYVKRKDRAVSSFDSAMDPRNYDPLPPVTCHKT